VVGRSRTLTVFIILITSSYIWRAILELVFLFFLEIKKGG